MSKPELLAAGAIAPNFNYRDFEGVERNTADLAGNPHVVYFYPKDDTPGCTREACAFRDAGPVFSGRKVEIIGVSPDSDASHEKFRLKHNLPFGLAADTDHSISKAYGAWGPKKFMGREYEGVHRVTFLVDSDGKIAKVYPKVKPLEHPVEIAADLENMS